MGTVDLADDEHIDVVRRRTDLALATAVHDPKTITCPAPGIADFSAMTVLDPTVTSKELRECLRCMAGSAG